MTPHQKPIIIASANCNVEWLVAALQPLWFGGEHAIIYNPSTRDVVTTTFNANGELQPWRA